MIFEGIVATTDSAGGMHLAAMGPHVDEACVDRATGTIERLTLKPFTSSETCGNLARLGEGVFHLTDDVLLLSRIVTGCLDRPPAARPAEAVRGFVLAGACMAYEFRVKGGSLSPPRAVFDAEVVRVHAGRPFLGLQRASHAVVEGAILVSRIGILASDEIRRQLASLAVLVEKTGGEREREAFAILEARMAREP